MKKKVKKIFFMLGPKCNLQCKYCLQHDMVEYDTVTVKPEVKEWLREQVPTDSEPPFWVIFYGGEPLVYWDTIKDIVKSVRGNVQYSMISNGKLMTADKVDFINDYGMCTMISWDGANVEKTRGYDVVKSNPCILDIKKLGFSAVLSSYTYPLDFLNEAEPILAEYKKIHGYAPMINIDTIMDFGNCGELRKMDCRKISEQMNFIIKHKKDKGSYYGIVSRLQKKYVFYKEYVDKRAVCGNGYTIWNVDINGDLYRCHNCGEKVGTIHDDPEDILARVKAIDPTYEYYKSKCKDCPAQPLCRSGCPMIDAQGREDYFCGIRKAYLGPIIEDFNTPKETGRIIHIG